MKALILTLTATFLGMASLALAQQAAESPRMQMRQACESDMKTLCPNTPAGPERRQCMQSNMSKLSEGCRAAIGAVKAEAAQMRTACRADFRQYCAGQTGPGRMQCLRENQDKLSQGCRDAMSAMGPAQLH